MTRKSPEKPESGWFTDKGAVLVAEADALCVADPAAKALRAELYRAEMMHHRAGWNELRPVMYVIWHDKDKGRFRLAPNEMYSTILNRLMDRFEGNGGAAMRAMASVTEDTMRANDALMWEMRANLSDQRYGEALHGMAVVMESWGLRGKDGLSEQELEERLQAADERRIHAHPDRDELRWAYGVGRDGHNWIVCRYRGCKPTAITFRHDDKPEEGTLVLEGNILNGMTRIVAALSDTQIPIALRRDRMRRQPTGEQG